MHCDSVFSEDDILEHSDEFECFYSSFTALAAYNICTVAGSGKYREQSLSALQNDLVKYLVWLDEHVNMAKNKLTK